MNDAVHKYSYAMYITIDRIVWLYSDTYMHACLCVSSDWKLDIVVARPMPITKPPLFGAVHHKHMKSIDLQIIRLAKTKQFTWNLNDGKIFY